MLQREIVLHKETDRLTSEFKNFCIREYVAGIRERDPAKCWPFGSISEFNDINNKKKAPVLQIPEPSTLISLEGADNTNALELAEGENSKGKEVESEAPTAFEVEVFKGKKAGSKTVTASLETSEVNETPLETATVFQLEWTNGNNTPTESDTATEDSDESDEDFTINGEDDSDDDTLDMFLRKRKCVKIASRSSGPRNYKKKKARKPKPSNPRPKGSKARIKRARPHGNFATRKRNRALDVVEADVAVSAAKRKKSGPNDMRGGTGRSVVGQPVAGVCGSKDPGLGCGMVVGMPGQRLTVVCVVNQNPADFSMPVRRNKHMLRL